MKRRPPPRRDTNRPPPATPQFHGGGRDSDASFCSSRLSSAGNLRSSAVTDHHSKAAAVKYINSYLASIDAPVSLSLKPLPSAKDVTDTFRLLFSRLGFSDHNNNNNNNRNNNLRNTNKNRNASTSSNNKLDDDVIVLLKFLNCPHKLSKSVLQAPGAPHSMPLLLSVLHWLVQVAAYADHLCSDENSSRYAFLRDPLMVYAVDSYVAYMSGADQDVEDLDRELAEKMEREKESLLSNLQLADEEQKSLEQRLKELNTRPSEREILESKKKDLERDLAKFQGFVANLQGATSVTQQELQEKEKELAVKMDEIRQLREENEEIKKKVEAQGINVRDAERMKRELLAVEREISEAEASRSSWEEKCWDLDGGIGQQLKKLETLSMECNQDLRRLKLGGGFQYVLNVTGSTPAEVLGINYKSSLKPAINSFADEIKRSTAAKLEEYISLQQQSKEMSAKTEAKRNRLAALQSHNDEMARHIDMIRNEKEQYTSWGVNEAQRLREDIEAKAHGLNILERQAVDDLKASELKMQEVERQCEQEIQCHANRLFALTDLVSRAVEHSEKKFSQMENDLLETTLYVSDKYKDLSTLIMTTPERC